MGAAIAVYPVEKYLQTSFRPDCDYIDGNIRERNVGELPHGRLQGYFDWLFRNHEEWGLEAVPEQRVQTGASRYRVADVCIISQSAQDELIVRTPPLVCIEILSRDDRMSEMQERVEDYLGMGAGAVWVIDPWRRRVFRSGDSGGLIPETQPLVVPGTSALVDTAAMFADLDRRSQAAKPTE